jgi:hypothetical protein
MVVETAVIVSSILIAFSIIVWWKGHADVPTETKSPIPIPNEVATVLEKSKLDTPLPPPITLPSGNQDAKETSTIGKPSGPQIPEQYRQTIGPVIRVPAFGERFMAFEGEPVDVPWAQAMETGLNDFIAVQGPQSSSVVEFIQCRSTACVIAGYSIPNQEGLDASILGDLRKQSWWEGGRTSSTHLARDDGTRSFVILIDRSSEVPPMAAPDSQ